MDFKNIITAIFLLILITGCSFNTIAQCNYADDSDAPEELFRKRVKESGMRYGNPYTMFVRGDDFNLQNTLIQIRNNIEKGQPFDRNNITNVYASLYKGIFTIAKTGEPAKCPETGNYFNDDGATTEECMHAAWTKNNAIVYLIGIKYLKI